jgi:hypothetical protein
VLQRGTRYTESQTVMDERLDHRYSVKLPLSSLRPAGDIRLGQEPYLGPHQQSFRSKTAQIDRFRGGTS